MEPANPTPPLRPLTPRITAVLFVCALVAAASMHLYTPMLDVIARDFQASPAQIGCVPAASMLGFLAGVALLAPLGDIVDKRSLTLAQLAANVLILSVMASTGSLWVLIGGNFLVGMMASTSQHLVTMTAQLVPPERRGAAVGVVLSGMMSGILTGRLLGGFIAASLGWRAAFWTGAALVLLILLLIARTLPRMPTTPGLRYADLLRSIATLLRRHPVLRRSSRVQGLLGICYGGFWATLAPMLAADHHLGSDVAGLIGLPGAAGVLVAAPVGRWVDRRGPGPAVLSGLLLVAAAYLVFGMAAWSVSAIFLGALLLDIGIRSSMVANQAYLVGIDPAARARTNMLFMLHTFGGNGIGALLASAAYGHLGWPGVVGVGLSAAAGAVVLHLVSQRAAAGLAPR